MKTKFKDKFITKRHELITEEPNVLKLIDVVNSHSVWYVKPKLEVGDLGWHLRPHKWFVNFVASRKQWELIITDLKVDFELQILDGSNDIYVIKKEES